MFRYHEVGAISSAFEELKVHVPTKPASYNLNGNERAAKGSSAAALE
jgi:hypothetical protein